MKFKPNLELFWFLKKTAKVDLESPGSLDAYVQQVITRGKTKDIKDLLKNVAPLPLKESISRIKRFLPKEVKMFWEDFIGSPNFTAKRTS